MRLLHLMLSETLEIILTVFVVALSISPAVGYAFLLYYIHELWGAWAMLVLGIVLPATILYIVSSALTRLNEENNGRAHD